MDRVRGKDERRQKGKPLIRKKLRAEQKQGRHTQAVRQDIKKMERENRAASGASLICSCVTTPFLTGPQYRHSGP
jgi:hypothetical protein